DSEVGGEKRPGQVECGDRRATIHRGEHTVRIGDGGRGGVQEIDGIAIDKAVDRRSELVWSSKLQRGGGACESGLMAGIDSGAELDDTASADIDVAGAAPCR